MLEMCEQMCGEYTGADFGDFNLGDLLGTILGALQDENYKVDPFLTNLSRGIIAMEGTLRTISPAVNILNYFTAKVDTGFSLDFSTENLKELNPEIGRALLQFAKGTTESAMKTAETLDMLEKGQIKVRADFGMEDKTIAVVSRLTGYAIRALLIIAFFIGSCLLCTVPAHTGDGMEVADAFAILGTAGYIISVFFAYRLYKDMKKGK